MGKKLVSEVPDYAWLNEADRDYLLVRLLFVAGVRPFQSQLVYHAHQAVEKYLKAILVHRSGRYWKTHNLDKLLDACQAVEPGSVDGVFRKLVEKVGPIDEVARYGAEAAVDPLRREARGMTIAGALFWTTPMMHALDCVSRRCHEVVAPDADHDLLAKAIVGDLDGEIVSVRAVILSDNPFAEACNDHRAQLVVEGLDRLAIRFLPGTP